MKLFFLQVAKGRKGNQRLFFSSYIWKRRGFSREISGKDLSKKKEIGLSFSFVVRQAKKEKRKKLVREG